MQIGPGSIHEIRDPKTSACIMISQFYWYTLIVFLKLKFHGYPSFFDKATYRVDSVMFFAHVASHNWHLKSKPVSSPSQERNVFTVRRSNMAMDHPQQRFSLEKHPNTWWVSHCCVWLAQDKSVVYISHGSLSWQEHRSCPKVYYLKLCWQRLKIWPRLGVRYCELFGGFANKQMDNLPCCKVT